jgi:PIN domain nuclease of toxin-antitoxin system
MRLLLDTHVFLWAISEPDRLSLKARNWLEADVSPFFSVASQWEIALKIQAGKLKIRNPVDFIPKHMKALKVAGLALKSAHVLRTFGLPDHHRDPFDRLLVAQALHEDCAIVTSDAMIARYPVNIIW